LACGRNYYGQLGNDTTNSILTPVPVLLNGKKVLGIAAGACHSLFLMHDGQVLACGLNGSGQLGNGTQADSLTPVPAQLQGQDVLDLAAGGSRSLFLMRDGDVLACGSNTYGQLGKGTPGHSSTPVPVRLNGQKVVGLAAGGLHSLFLMDGGHVLACGSNDYGPLGIGTQSESLTPVPVPLNGQKVLGLAAGGSHSLLLMHDGNVLACGLNDDGSLGTGTQAHSLTPVPVPLDARKVSGVAAGGSHSFFLMHDGNILACGSNDRGALGIGTRIDSFTPVPVQIDGKVSLPGDSYVFEGMPSPSEHLEKDTVSASVVDMDSKRGILEVDSDQLAGLEPEKIALRSAVADLGCKLEALHLANVTLQEKHGVLEAAHDQLAQQCEELKASYKFEMIALKGAVADLQSKHEAPQVANTDPQGKYEAWAAGHEQLLQDVEELKASHKELHFTRSSLWQAYDKLKSIHKSCLPDLCSLAATVEPACCINEEKGHYVGHDVVLKLKHEGNFYRVRLEFKNDALSYTVVVQAVEQVVGVKYATSSMRYQSTDADLCVLCPATFSDFARSARWDCSGAQVFELEVSMAALPLHCQAHSMEAHKQDEGIEIHQQDEGNVNDKDVGEHLVQGDYRSNGVEDNDEASLQSSECCFALEGRGRCFVQPTTLVALGDGNEPRAAQSLKVGDRVLSHTGFGMEVAFVQHHARELRQLVTLKTTQAELTVPMDHRIAMPGDRVRHAGQLAVGDIVMCGKSRHQLTKVMQFTERVALVELGFNLDSSFRP